jgi:drug/metabolite transporter (DMT)-like permease
MGAWALFDFHLAGPSGAGIWTHLWGRLLALGGAILIGFTVALVRALRKRNGPVVIYLYMCTMGTLITLPVFLRDPKLPGTPLEWGLVGLIVATAIVAQVAMNQGFFYCRSWEGGLYMSMDAVFSMLVGILFLGEPVTWRLFVGGGMILTGVVAMNLLRGHKSDRSVAPPAAPPVH